MSSSHPRKKSNSTSSPDPSRETSKVSASSEPDLLNLDLEDYRELLDGAYAGRQKGDAKVQNILAELQADANKQQEIQDAKAEKIASQLFPVPDPRSQQRRLHKSVSQDSGVSRPAEPVESGGSVHLRSASAIPFGPPKQGVPVDTTLTLPFNATTSCWITPNEQVPELMNELRRRNVITQDSRETVVFPEQTDQRRVATTYVSRGSPDSGSGIPYIDEGPGVERAEDRVSAMEEGRLDDWGRVLSGPDLELTPMGADADAKKKRPKTSRIKKDGYTLMTPQAPGEPLEGAKIVALHDGTPILNSQRGVYGRFSPPALETSSRRPGVGDRRKKQLKDRNVKEVQESTKIAGYQGDKPLEAILDFLEGKQPRPEKKKKSVKKPGPQSPEASDSSGRGLEQSPSAPELKTASSPDEEPAASSSSDTEEFQEMESSPVPDTEEEQEPVVVCTGVVEEPSLDTTDVRLFASDSYVAAQLPQWGEETPPPPQHGMLTDDGDFVEVQRKKNRHRNPPLTHRSSGPDIAGLPPRPVKRSQTPPARREHRGSLPPPHRPNGPLDHRRPPAPAKDSARRNSSSPILDSSLPTSVLSPPMSEPPSTPPQALVSPKAPSEPGDRQWVASISTPNAATELSYSGAVLRRRRPPSPPHLGDYFGDLVSELEQPKGKAMSLHSSRSGSPKRRGRAIRSAAATNQVNASSPDLKYLSSSERPIFSADDPPLSVLEPAEADEDSSALVSPPLPGNKSWATIAAAKPSVQPPPPEEAQEEIIEPPEQEEEETEVAEEEGEVSCDPVIEEKKELKMPLTQSGRVEFVDEEFFQGEDSNRGLVFGDWGGSDESTGAQTPEKTSWWQELEKVEQSQWEPEDEEHHRIALELNRRWQNSTRNDMAWYGRELNGGEPKPEGNG